MSMFTYVVLLRSRDNETYQKNLKVLEACREDKVPLPHKISDYFGEYENPEFPLTIKFEPRAWRSDSGYEEGCEVDLDSLPEGVETIRFCVS